MRLPCCVAACLPLLGTCVAGLAQTAAAPPLAALAPASAALPASAPQRASVGPQTQIIEDKAVRIEETRVRGQLQRVVVQSKIPGTKPYEIQVGAGGRDPSQDHGVAGRRTWSLLDF